MKPPDARAADRPRDDPGGRPMNGMSWPKEAHVIIESPDPTTARRPPLVPWWVIALAGAACVVVGVVITARPFTSLSVLIILVAIGFSR
jgi:hypothetical protein